MSKPMITQRISYRELLGLPLNANLKRHKTYRAWAGLQNRVTKTWHHAYEKYRELGVSICDRWCGKDGFRNFLEDMGHPPTPKHSLERKCNTGPYSPDNCVWATYEEQNRNKRSCHYIDLPEGRMTASEAARLRGVPAHRVLRRIARGVSGEALFAPSMKIKRTGVNHA